MPRHPGQETEIQETNDFESPRTPHVYVREKCFILYADRSSTTRGDYDIWCDGAVRETTIGTVIVKMWAGLLQNSDGVVSPRRRISNMVDLIEPSYEANGWFPLLFLDRWHATHGDRPDTFGW